MRTVQAKSLFLGKFHNYNVYRGCTHGCIYCDSRSHCYQIEGVFEDIIVKSNAVELAKKELANKRSKIMLTSGSMCDPYMPIEEQLQISRGVLEVILKYGHGASFLTKNTLALRDLDLMEQINQKARAVACFTLTTLDDTLASQIEPHASLPSKRLEALKIYHDHGIPTGVWMTPLLPFLTAEEDNVRNIVRACGEAGVSYIVGFFGTTMREGSREYFYQQLDQLYPGLKERYQEAYGNAYLCDAPNHQRLKQVFIEECKRYGIAYSNHAIKEIRQIPLKCEQLSLF